MKKVIVLIALVLAGCTTKHKMVNVTCISTKNETNTLQFEKENANTIKWNGKEFSMTKAKLDPSDDYSTALFSKGNEELLLQFSTEKVLFTHYPSKQSKEYDQYGGCKL